MNKFNFDEKVVRRGTNSIKWDEPKEDGVLPMWVADMDFKTAPCILEALKQRLDHGVFGYTNGRFNVKTSSIPRELCLPFLAH